MILAGLLAYMLVHARDIKTPRLLAFSLIFAGGTGNILDRLLFDRHVSDFISQPTYGQLYLSKFVRNYVDRPFRPPPP